MAWGDLQVPTMETIHNKGVLVGGLIAGAVLGMSDVLLYGSKNLGNRTRPQRVRRW